MVRSGCLTKPRSRDDTDTCSGRIYKVCENVTATFSHTTNYQIDAFSTSGLQQLESIEDVWELTSLQSRIHCLSNKENSIVEDNSGENISVGVLP